jgi:hypothetical protein
MRVYSMKTRPQLLFALGSLLIWSALQLQAGPIAYNIAFTFGAGFTSPPRFLPVPSTTMLRSKSVIQFSRSLWSEMATHLA